MATEYICTGYGVDKKTGEPFWTVAPIFEGETKEGHRPFGMIQNDQRMTVSTKMEIGERRTFSLVAE